MSKMKKDVKKLIFAGSCLIALTAATVMLLHMQGTEDYATADNDAESKAAEEADTAALTLTDYSVDDIKSVVIKNSSDEYEIETITAENEYVIKGLESLPLDSSSLKTGVSYLANIKAGRLVEEGASDLAKYGLSEPSATIEIMTYSGESTVLYVGDPAPTDNSTYVRMDNSNDVYVVSTYYVSRSLKTKYAFITTSFTEAIDTSNPPVVSRLVIKKQGEEPIVINEAPVTPEGQPLKGVHMHEFETPVGVGIDVVKGEQLVYGLYGLSAIEAVSHGADNIDYLETGLDAPMLTVEMTGDNNYTLTIGLPVMEETAESSQKLKGYYGIFSELPETVFIFAESSLPWLDIDYEDIMTRLFLLPGIFNIDSVKVEAGDYNLTLKSEGDSQEAVFSVNGEIYENQDNFKYFYQYLISASAENIYGGEAIGALSARFTYSYRDPALQSDVVEFFSSSDRKLVISVNGEPLYRIKDNYIKRLYQNIEALNNGDEIIISW